MGQSQITPLYDRHVSLGARIVNFAGWKMPVAYRGGIVSEVKACRSAAGLFDVSHMGQIEVSGPGAASFLQRATANDIARLEPGGAQYSLLLNQRGGIIDDVIVYRRETSFLVVVNAARQQADLAWLLDAAGSAAPEAVRLGVQDVSDAWALVAVQGPKALELVRSALGADLAAVSRFHTVAPQAGAGAGMLLSRTGYTGEDGAEIFCAWDAAPALWDALVDAGATPCGLGARDVLRLEAGYPLYGHELDEDHTPYESGVGWAVRLAKGEFVGRTALVAQRAAGVAFRLAGLRVVDPANAIPRAGYAVFACGDNAPVGATTSGTLSPTLGSGIALARLRTECASAGMTAQIDIRGHRASAEVVALPFYRAPGV